MKTMRSIAALVLALLLVPNAALAQPSSEPEPSYLDFGQFSTVASEDQLGFFDKLTLAGMNVLGAPAARGVVSLYEYDSADIVDVACSDDRYKNRNALLLSWRSANDPENQDSEGSIASQESGPVWVEVSFSNACQLQEALEHNNIPDISWQPVEDPKLRWISRTSVSGTGESDELHVIVTEPFFPESAPTRYFAECAPANERQSYGRSLCGEILQ